MAISCEELAGHVIADASARHQRKALEYWNGLRSVVEWWDGLPSNLRQDIEGSGREPYAIVKARKCLERS